MSYNNLQLVVPPASASKKARVRNSEFQPSHRRMRSREDGLAPSVVQTMRDPKRREGKVYLAGPEAHSFWEGDLSDGGGSSLLPLGQKRQQQQQKWRKSPRHQHHHQQQMDLSQTQPTRAFIQGAGSVPVRPISPLELASMAPECIPEGIPEGICSDEGELVAECFICLQAFDEDCPSRVPRNLRCGHAYCTGEPLA